MKETQEKSQKGREAVDTSQPVAQSGGMGKGQTNQEMRSEGRLQSESTPERRSQNDQINTQPQSTGNDQRTRQRGLMARDQFLPSQWMENPWTMMQRFSEEIDRIFDNFGMGRSLLGSRSGHGQDFRQSMWSPQVEVYERDNNLMVCADLPGMKKEDIHIELTDDMLMIRGERRSESDDTQEGYRRSERSYGSFARSIPLPEGVNVEKAQASFEDGVLKVSLPLPPQQRPRSRRIEVQSKNAQSSEGQKSASSST